MPTETKTIGTNSRQYSTITSWESLLDTDYTTGVDAIGEGYNDSVFGNGSADEAITINSGGAIGLTSVTLRPATGEGHDGTAGTGVRIVITSATGSYALVMDRADLLVDAIEIDLNGYQKSGVQQARLSNTLYTQHANRCIVHEGNTSLGSGFSNGFNGSNDRQCTYTNCIGYNFKANNGGSTAPAYVFGGSDDKSTYINCVAHNADRVDANSAGEQYGFATGSLSTVQNCIATSITHSGGYVEECFAMSGTNTHHNLSSDTTASGTGSLTNKNADDLFISTVSGFEDLHLKPGCAAVGTGADLTGTVTDVEIDISGRDRTNYPSWDIGAAQFVHQADKLGGEKFWWNPTVTENHTDLITDNNGTASGGVTIERDRGNGGINAGVFPAGGTGQVALGQPSWASCFASDFTVSFWLKQAQIIGSQEVGLFGNDSNAGDWIALSLNLDGKVRFYADDGTTNANALGSTSVDDGEWHHIVFKRTVGTGYELLIDGVSESTASDNNGVVIDKDLYIGRSFNGAYMGTTDDPGYLSDFRAYNRSLAPSEVAELASKRNYQRRLAAKRGNPILLIDPSADKFGSRTTTLAHDLSGSGNNGTLNGNTNGPPSYVNDSERNGRRALKTIGAANNDYVEASLDVTSLSSISVSFWMKREVSYASNGRFLSIGWSGADDIRFFSTDGASNLTFTMDDGATTGQVSTTIGTDWVHVCGTHDGSTQSLYIDGVLIASNAKTFTYASQTVKLLRLGARTDALSGFTAFTFDGVAIHDYALTADEVRYYAASRSTEKPYQLPGLVAQYCPSLDLASARGDLGPIDLTFAGNNGTLEGSATYDLTDTDSGGSAAFSLDGLATCKVSLSTAIDLSGESSVSAWVKVTGEDAGYVINNQGFSPNLAYSLEMVGPVWNERRFRLAISGDGTTQESVSSTTNYYGDGVDKWVNVCAVFSPGNYIKLYIDGVEEASAATAITSVYDPGYATKLGSQSTSDYLGLLGLIDNVEIYNRALTPPEISAKFAWGRDGQPKSYNQLFGMGVSNEDRSLEGWWKLDAADGADSSTAKGDLTPNNSPTVGGGPTSWLSDAVVLDGVNQSLNRVEDASNLYETVDQFSYGLRVNPDTLSNNLAGMSLSKTNESDHQTTVWRNLAEYRAATRVNGSFVTADAPNNSAVVGQWDSIACRFSPDSRDIILNGVTRDSEITALSSSYFNDISIGRLGDISPSSWWDGLVSDAYLFRRLLTDLEFTEQHTGPELLYHGTTDVVFSATPTEDAEASVTFTTGEWKIDPAFGSGTNGTPKLWQYFYLADDQYGTNPVLAGTADHPAGLMMLASDVGKFLRIGVRSYTTEAGVDWSEPEWSTAWTEVQPAAGGGGLSIPIAAYYYNHLLMV